jgi:hypothetical protein
MGGIKRRKVIQDNMSAEKKNQSQELASKHYTGFLQQSMPEAVPDHNTAPSETVMRGTQNSYVIFGKDRIGPLDNGHGSIPNTHCGKIDLVAGMSGILAREQAENDPVKTNTNAFLDAARVYISQKTDIDAQFGLAAGFVGNSVAKAGIAIKADAVRIIGREGIKLVTFTDVSNAPGISTMASKGGIDIIANNDDGLTKKGVKKLQPLVKGDNLVHALNFLAGLINDVNSNMTQFLMLQTKFNIATAAHMHPPLLPSPITATAGVALFVDMASFLAKLQAIPQNTHIVFRQNYCNSTGKWAIRSTNNRAN